MNGSLRPQITSGSGLACSIQKLTLMAIQRSMTGIFQIPANASSSLR